MKKIFYIADFRWRSESDQKPGAVITFTDGTRYRVVSISKRTKKVTLEEITEPMRARRLNDARP